MEYPRQSVLPAMRIDADHYPVRTAWSLTDEVLTEARYSLRGTQAEDLRTLAAQPPTVVPIDESRNTYYHFFESPGAEHTVVHFQPVANDLEHHPQGASQAIAMNALGYNVLFLSQNATQLTKDERRKVWHGDLTPLGEQRLRILEFAANEGHIELGSIALAGYSFGASDAAITSALIAEKGIGTIRSSVFGEPANITNRNVLKLLLDFAGPKAAGGKQFIDSVLLSQDPALIELWDAKRGAKTSSYMKEDFAHFARAILKRDNLWLAAALRHNRFTQDVERGLVAQKGGVMVLHKDHDSVLTPEADFSEVERRLTIAAKLGDVTLISVRSASEPWVGHAIGDNPWFWASLVRLSLDKTI